MPLSLDRGAEEFQVLTAGPFVFFKDKTTFFTGFVFFYRGVSKSLFFRELSLPKLFVCEVFP